MPLSISKLEEFLMEKGFGISKIFTLEGYCFYIEVMSLVTSDICLLYIPSKYDIRPDNRGNVYKLKYLDMSRGDSITDEYAGKLDDMIVADAYDVDPDIHSDGDAVENRLEKNYRHAISLNDVSTDDITDVKAIYRQLMRLKYCVQNLDYKLAILHRNYLCVIRRTNQVECLSVKGHRRGEYKRLLIVVDLETFYSKGDRVSDDIKIVRESIYKVLEKNQTAHERMIDRISESKKDISSIPGAVSVKIRKYESLIGELDDMLGDMSVAEKDVQSRLDSLDKGTAPGIQGDISKVHRRSQLEREMERVISLKGEIVRSLVALREKSDDSILTIDKIMFDNNVMFDAMVRNFAKLKELC
jgi:hypothetical protein